jgi:hypothetical protein
MCAPLEGGSTCDFRSRLDEAARSRPAYLEVRKKKAEESWLVGELGLLPKSGDLNSYTGEIIKNKLRYPVNFREKKSKNLSLTCSVTAEGTETPISMAVETVKAAKDPDVAGLTSKVRMMEAH